ncbi:translation initiation factor IF-2-like [Ursus arctos]|uniref:translation initiation factor IF-2-like n=1 Tax=Ursus arctos TaxID=9644 RepID=UPI000E6DB5B4|nr:translation initiation factor IF-2-like [Ursus arctos]
MAFTSGSVEECGEKATQSNLSLPAAPPRAQLCPSRSAAHTPLRAPGARRGGGAGVRAPGAAGAGPRPAHPSARRCPGGPRGTPAAEAPGEGRAGAGSGPRRAAGPPRPPPRRRAGRRTYRVGLRRRPGVTAGRGGQALTPDAGRPGAGHSPSVRLHQAEGARTRRAALEGAGELAGVGPAPPSVPVRREQLSAPPPPARPRPLRAGPRAPGDRRRRRRRHRPGAFPTPPTVRRARKVTFPDYPM